MAKTGHMYTYDSSQNVIFPEGVSAKSFTENGKTLSATYIAKSVLTTKGDMIYASGASTPTKLGIGSNGQFLSVAGGIPKWVGNPNTDTHYTARLYVGVKDQASTSAASTNGTVYLKLVENGTIRDQHKIAGSGATTVTSNASGDITITTPTKAADADKLDGQDSSYYLDYNHLKNRPPAYKYTYQNGYLVVQAL